MQRHGESDSYSTTTRQHAGLKAEIADSLPGFGYRYRLSLPQGHRSGRTDMKHLETKNLDTVVAMVVTTTVRYNRCLFPWLTTFALTSPLAIHFQSRTQEAQALLEVKIIASCFLFLFLLEVLFPSGLEIHRGQDGPEHWRLVSFGCALDGGEMLWGSCLFSE